MDICDKNKIYTEPNMELFQSPSSLFGLNLFK